MNRAARLIAFVGLAIASAGCAAECVPTVEDGWIRPGPPSMPMRAGFGTIENSCDAAVAITGASSPAFGDVSVHESTVVDGISRMREVAELVVPAHGSVTLAPGGYHLMLMQPTAELAPGDKVQVEFTLRDGSILRGELEVRQQVR